MRKFGIVAGCVGLAVLISGCDPNERAYFRGGIGTDLYTVDAAAAADLQNVYLDNLCRQSLSYVGAGVPSCGDQPLASNWWPLIVQAGMNDIDQRCDAYLSWLDQKKRENGAILAEIGAIRVAVDALTNPAIATGISPIALASVAAAFGLATSTLANVNSLLLQVDHTTVQSVVFANRRDFREQVRRMAIENKPIVVHALRSYLQICMPMTIAANINSTVTVFQNTAPGVAIRPMVTAPVGPPVAPVVVVAPQRADKPITVTAAPKQPAPGTQGPIETVVLGLDRAKQIQRAMCVADSGDMSAPVTRAALVDFKAALFFPRKSSAINSGIIENEDQLAEIDKAMRRVNSCTDRKLAGPFEAGVFGKFGDVTVKTRIKRALEKAGLQVPAELGNPALPWGDSIHGAVTTLRDSYKTKFQITAGNSIDEPVWTQIVNDNIVQ
jgi:hypothetical protein